MGELELVARVDNRLLLRDETGAEFHLSISPKLKSLVYAAQATPPYAPLTPSAGTAQAPSDSTTPKAGSKAESSAKNPPDKPRLAVLADIDDPAVRLRPAELQIRLRAGDTPEHLAQFSDLTAEQIAKFARPIEAEKQEAIRAMQRVRLPGGEADSLKSHLLGDLVAQRLSARGIPADLATWQARRDIGAPWLVELKFQDGARHHNARWTFDRARNHVTALDDEARWLISPETPLTTTIPISLHQSKRSGTGAGAAAGDGDSHPETGHTPLVSGAPLPVSARFSKSGSDSSATDSHRGRPDLHPVKPLLDDGANADSNAAASSPGLTAEPVAGIVPISRWQAEKTETVAMPIASHPAGKALGKASASAIDGGSAAGADAQLTPEVPATPAETMSEALQSTARLTGTDAPASMLFDSIGASVPAAASATSSPAAHSSRKSGRAKIPSWDEIVFGSKE